MEKSLEMNKSGLPPKHFLADQPELTTNMVMTANPMATRPSIDELTAQVHTPKSCTKVYWDIWKTFKLWVDGTDGQSKSDDGKYLLRDNVDRFFLNEVKSKTIVLKSARRLAGALQFFADN